jgi:diguanylate cyclase (GGDEF)-like protein
MGHLMKPAPDPARQASRILAVSGYAAAAALVVLIPLLYLVMRLGARDADLAGETVAVFSATVIACVATLALAHLGPLRHVRRIEEDLYFRAEHDPLTGLLNREALRQRLAEARSRADRSGSPMAVMFLDLDDFKAVNDTLGHAMGDALLREVGGRIKECVRLGDTVARMGGDEFALVFENTDADAASAVAANLLRKVREPYHQLGRPHDVSCSLGISVHPVDVNGDGDQLLAHANMAMQQGKGRGKNDFTFYSSEMQSQREERVRLQARVRQAWEQGGFTMHYQPIVNVGLGRMTGAEALLRWVSREHGDVSPALFVPILEEMGLVDAVGTWVIREACRQARAWSDAGLPPFMVSVNVSPFQFRSGEALVAVIQEALATADLHASRLQVEITEGTMMENRDDALLTLNQLKALGVTIAVDDFGTGYSSLAYLKHFPVDTLKIDRAFVKELSEKTPDSNIVAAIVQLAHGLGLSVMAEGVETEAQLELLQRYGCDVIQGYVLSPPLSTARFERGILRNPDWMNDASLRVPVPPVRRHLSDEDDDRTMPVRP